MRPTTDWQQETYNPSWDHFRQLTAPWCSLNSDKIRGTDLSISFSWSKIGPVDHRLTDMSIDDMHEQRKTSIAYLHLQSQRTFQMDEHRHNKWQLLRYRIKNINIIVLSWSIHGILNRCIVELKKKRFWNEDIWFQRIWIYVLCETQWIWFYSELIWIIS